MTRNSKKLVYGVGVKGDGVATVNGKTTKAYVAWNHMLGRCYCPKSLSKYPTYTGCSVCDEWLFFPTFKEWFDNNYIAGFHLDKDLLVAGNKIYSPDTCVFAPPVINNLFTDHGRSRGEYPIGITFIKQKRKFKTQLKIDGTQKHLGLFDSVEDASQAYLIAKKANVIRMANEWRSKIPTKLYEALIKKADGMV